MSEVVETQYLLRVAELGNTYVTQSCLFMVIKCRTAAKAVSDG